MDTIQIELTLEELACAHSGLSALLTIMMDIDHARPDSKEWNERIDLVVKTMNKLTRRRSEIQSAYDKKHNITDAE